MNIALLGYGKMGREVERAAIAQGHTVTVKIDNENDWQAWLKNGSQKVDAAIDFSTPQTATVNIERCFDLHIPVVVGTTGWNTDIERLKERCLRENEALFHSSNFSIGVYLFIKTAKFLAKTMPSRYTPSISETHHIHKLDKPSGTALTLRAETFGKITDNTAANIAVENVPIESIREGEINGIHTLKFASTEDEITLTHTAYSRAGFALGAVKAAEFLQGKQGWFTMNDMLE
ncbi:MAG: 4-hydroxy-tetrahydrodipicolinate reductase [Bacteroidales bacterium]|jgi:4-hydroxy-tetrahydrodipicolinate reductase|nr:4-hydroxy-tetrahydrodipicolinate reductase [Bacteroidales bacterium]